jgi:uncharacterized membrane protein
MFSYGTLLVLDKDEGMDVGKIFGVFWSVAVGIIRLGYAMPHLGAIIGAKLAASEIFAVIDRVIFFFIYTFNC